MNEYFAELCGIHTGDGYLRYVGKRKEWDCSGNNDEKEYYDRHIKKLIQLLGFECNAKYFKARNTYGIVIRDSKFLKLFEECGFPSGAKTTKVQVPKIILKKKKWILRFLRGYFDTDGCITFSRKKGNNYSEFKKQKKYYPRICLSTVSKSLAEDLTKILESLSFKYYAYSIIPKNKKESIKYCIHLNGKEQIKKWFRIIGSKNNTKKIKYLVWKEHGFYSKKLESVLKGQENPNMLG